MNFCCNSRAAQSGACGASSPVVMDIHRCPQPPGVHSGAQSGIALLFLFKLRFAVDIPQKSKFTTQLLEQLFKLQQSHTWIREPFYLVDL